MGKVITIGEPMGMFVAQQEGPLKDVENFQRYIAGAELNVAVGVSRLGHDIQYVSAVGNDPFGAHIIDFLTKEKIDSSHVKISTEFPTGFQLKNKDSKNDPEVVYFRNGSAASHLTVEDIKNIDFSNVDIFHVTGILMALNDDTYNLIKILIKKAKENQTLVTFDPNLRTNLWQSQKLMIERINGIAKEVDVILPGVGEGEILTGSKDLNQIADFYLTNGTPMVIIKNGEKGSFLKYQEKEKVKELFVPSFKVEHVVDTVGAGDGFAVGILTGLLENLPFEKMLERGNAIGAIQVSHISDNENLPTPEKLAEFITSQERRKNETTDGN